MFYKKKRGTRETNSKGRKSNANYKRTFPLLTSTLKKSTVFQKTSLLNSDLCVYSSFNLKKINIYDEVESLRELTKLSPKGKCVDLLTNSLNQFFKTYSWVARDVTKNQTKKLSILLSFYFHEVLQYLNTFT